jgi:UDP-glucose 4-epimerase
MRVLVTGANGFLGRYLAQALLERGHEVRALVRSLHGHVLPADADIVVGDLRDRRNLPSIVANVDAVVHLAACVKGDDDSQFIGTVVATENLLDATSAAGIDRFLLCSSFSVYDWRQPATILDEQTPMEADLYARDVYAIAKTWQERLVRRYAEQNGWRLTVVRPGFLWGRENIWIAATGHSFGKWHVVFGGERELPISYVENCAECLAIAIDHPAAVGETFNVVDDERASAWRYMGEALRRMGAPGRRIYVPYWLGMTVARLASGFGRLIFGRTAKLPGLLVPIRFRARFRPLQFTNRKAIALLGWRPRWSFEEAWQRIAVADERRQSAPVSSSAAPTPSIEVRQ